MVFLGEMMSMGLGYFLVRRLHSLTGLILSAAFLFCFLIPYSSALSGAKSFDNFMIGCQKIPLVSTLQVVMVLLPLVFHATVGFSIIYSSRFNVVSYGNYRNWMYAIQRITGILLIPFLVYHIYNTQVAFAFTGRYADYAFVQHLLAPAWVRVIYYTGVVCASLHIGGGIATALVRWGVTASRRAQDVTAMVMWVVTLILAAWGLRVVAAF